MRSPAGASAAELRAVRRGKLIVVANVALALEYEATCGRPEHIAASGLNPTAVSVYAGPRGRNGSWGRGQRSRGGNRDA